MRSAAMLTLLLVVVGCSDASLGEGVPVTRDSPTITSTAPVQTADSDPPPISVPVTTSAEWPLPDLSGERLGLRGIGPLQIGVTFEDLADLGFEITTADCATEYIRFAPNGLVAVRRGPLGSNPAQSDTLTGLYIWFDNWNGDLVTHSGIGAGSTRDDVLATYGDKVAERSVEVEDYDPDIQTFEDRIEFIPVDAEDSHLRMIFWFNEDDTLRGIRTGEPDAIKDPYLCA